MINFKSMILCLDSFFMMKNANKKMAIAKGGREVNEKMGEGNF